jgi:signal transduction histidine kinase
MASEPNDPTDPDAHSALPAPLYRFLTHELRTPLAAMLGLLQQGLRRPAESHSHGRLEKLIQQTQLLIRQLDAVNQTLWAPPTDTTLQETLLENLLQNACDQARAQATAKQQTLRLQTPARCAFVPTHSQFLVQAVTATLQLSIAQAPQAATITLHCTLRSHCAQLHIGYFPTPGSALPSEHNLHTLQLPLLVYD